MGLRAIRAGLVALIASGCESSSSDEQTVVEDAITTVSAEVAQLRIYDRLLHKVDVRGLVPELATPQAIKNLRAALTAELADPKCMTVATDDRTYLALELKKCRYAGVYVDGGLRLDITSEAGVCDGKACVVANAYAITATDLTLGKSRLIEATTRLRIPTDSGEPREYEARAEIETATGELLTGRTELSWLRANGCATAQLGLQLEAEGIEVSVAGTDLVVCNSRCPRAGSVLLAWDSGSTLAWDYADDGELRVTGPHGRTFTVAADCSAD